MIARRSYVLILSVLIASLAAAAGRTQTAQTTPRLLFDANRQSTGTKNGSSAPSILAGGKDAIAVATMPGIGREPVRIGLNPVKIERYDMTPGQGSTTLAVIGQCPDGTRLAVAGSDRIVQLVRLPAGGGSAVLLKVLSDAPGVVSPTVTEAVEMNGKLYFVVRSTIEDAFNQELRDEVELFAYCKNPERVERIKKIGDSGSAEIGDPVRVGNELAFWVDFGPGPELWRSDCTATLTTRVVQKTGRAGKMVVLGNKMVFEFDDGVSGSELWVSDLTPSGTRLVRDIRPGVEGSRPSDLALFGARAVFAADDGSAGHEIWVTDGSGPGTKLLIDLAPGPASSDPADFFLFGGKIYFSAEFPGLGRELGVTDGTASGTNSIDVWPGSNGSEPEEFTPGPGALFFRGSNASSGPELFKTRGTPQDTTLVRDIRAGRVGSTPYGLTLVNGRLLFVADAGTDEELWQSDGTAPGTVPVADLFPPAPATAGSSPGGFVDTGTKTFYRALTTSAGFELVATEGTTASTNVIDIHPGSNHSFPDGMTALGDGRVLLTASTANAGREPVVSDGTTQGTMLLRDIRPGMESSDPGGYAELFDGYFAFRADDGMSGGEYWLTDGTSAGTRMRADLNPGRASSNPDGWTRFFDKVKAAFAAEDIQNGREPWVDSFAESAGPALLADIRPGPLGSNPRALTAAGSFVFFLADDGTNGEELWRTNGTKAGTVLVKDLRPGSASPFDPRRVPAIAAFGNKVFFAANDGTHGEELWCSDGTSAGTRLVRDIAPGAGSSTPRDVVVADGRMFFSAFAIGVTGRELWTSDGTSAGTEVIDIVPGPASSSPVGLVAVGDRVFFSANVSAIPRAGGELFRSDGTPGGTTLIADIWPGAFSGFPLEFTLARGRLVFSATDQLAGREAWILDRPGASAQPFGIACGDAPELCATAPRIARRITFAGNRAPKGHAGILVLSARPATFLPLGGGCFAYFDLATMFAPHAFVVTQQRWSFQLPLPADFSLVALPPLVAQAVFLPLQAPAGVQTTQGLLLDIDV